MRTNLLNENDVIASDALETSFHSQLEMPQTFRVKELQEKIRQLVIEELQFDFDQLVRCQVLRPEQTEWKTGSVQVKLAVTFIEDSTESSIDLGRGRR